MWALQHNKVVRAPHLIKQVVQIDVRWTHQAPLATDIVKLETSLFGINDTDTVKDRQKSEDRRAGSIARNRA
ncbi:hypothetical protein SRABI35_03299 [Stenotrophomonas lactitubi]|nr:hypothetical protein SRABI35_03299 [Stenotrophomonas lactitubi]